MELDSLCAFIGKNDVGKSTVLEALDFFFNNGKDAGTIKKLDKGDINKAALASGDETLVITAVFEELPETVIIDASNETNLSDEFLLNSEQRLEVIKKYPKAGAAKVFIRAHHPTNPSCNDLLLKTQAQLRAVVDGAEIECADRTKNAVMRSAIWSNYSDDLQLEEVEIEISKGDAKNIYQKLEGYFPLYSLFQSDRKNSDGDSEVQDPLQYAVKEILGDENIQTKLQEVAEEVESKLKEVADQTLEKLREMNPEVASSLIPEIPSSDALKWKDVFKSVSIAGDGGIPINKRGSGIKRLVLLNFFRAEAERRQAENAIPSIIYAIEEPETSQHTGHQKELIRAFIELSQAANTQIFITTHSPFVVKQLGFDNLRLITDGENGKRIDSVEPGQLPYPSLNEVNCLAFDEATEEYHNELYGFIEAEDRLTEYKTGRDTVRYVRQRRTDTIEQQIILTEFIRHQIHHPENTLNAKYTFEQLRTSIDQMREFLRAEL